MKENREKITPFHYPLITEWDQQNPLDFYILEDAQTITQAACQGALELCGRDLLVLRVDMALACLLPRLGDYFHDALFASRAEAAREIYYAAHIAAEDDGQTGQLLQQLVQALDALEEDLRKEQYLQAAEDKSEY